MVRARSIHLAAAFAALAFAAPDTGSGSGGVPADAEPLFGHAGGDTLTGAAAVPEIPGLDPAAMAPASIAANTASADASASAVSAVPPAAVTPEPAAPAPPAKAPPKARAKGATPKASPKPSAAKTAAPRKQPSKAEQEAEPRVAVVMQTSRISDPATGFAIARHRVVSTPESRALAMVEDGLARLADDEEIEAAETGVGIVDLPAAD